MATKPVHWRGCLLVLCLLLTSGMVVADGPDYVLGPGDLVKVSVYGYDDMTTQVRVSQSGYISVPLLGAVKVAGMSTQNAASHIATGLVTGGFIRDPKVDVLVVEYQSQQVSVLGQVAKPGKYPLSGRSTVLDLLADAGGLVSAQAGDEATLLRKSGKKLPLDLHALFQGDLQQNYTVAGGDTIFVPKAPQFYVYGQVQHPGMYRLERHMTVAQAITAGGGLTDRGTERGAYIKRRNKDGKDVEIDVDDDTELKPDDVLHIGESWF